MIKPSLVHIHAHKQGKVSDKWSSYLHYYDQLFAPLQHEHMSILEIGVQNGGSLDTWCEYFEHAAHVIGCDVNPACAQLTYDDPRVSVVIGDVNSAYVHAQIQKITPQLHVVIDDGSHQSRDIIHSFITYFDMLVPGGIYVIEDTHTLYWDSWGGELSNGLNAYILFKKLIDVINREFWPPSMTVDTYLRDFFPHGAPEFIHKGCIQQIEFRNSMICIRKATHVGASALGPRWVTGNQALINSQVKQDHGDTFGT